MNTVNTFAVDFKYLTMPYYVECSGLGYLGAMPVAVVLLPALAGLPITNEGIHVWMVVSVLPVGAKSTSATMLQMTALLYELQKTRV